MNYFCKEILNEDESISKVENGQGPVDRRALRIPERKPAEWLGDCFNKQSEVELTKAWVGIRP